jgi:hypothetical protein
MTSVGTGGAHVPLAGHKIENCGAASPILAPGTRPEKQATYGHNTVVVRLLAKEKVVS